MKQWQFEPQNTERVPPLKIAENLRMLRTYHSICQKEIAKLLHLERSAYAYYETGRTHPSLPSLMKLALLYNVTTDFLLGMPPKENDKLLSGENNLRLNDKVF